MTILDNFDIFEDFFQPYWIILDYFGLLATNLDVFGIFLTIFGTLDIFDFLTLFYHFD